MWAWARDSAFVNPTLLDAPIAHTVIVAVMALTTVFGLDVVRRDLNRAGIGRAA